MEANTESYGSCKLEVFVERQRFTWDALQRGKHCAVEASASADLDRLCGYVRSLARASAPTGGHDGYGPGISGKSLREKRKRLAFAFPFD